MAHLIDTMAYTGQTPWHGLGNILPPQQSLDIWLKAAGMDWTIEQSDVMFNVASDALHIRPYSDSKVLYRSDTLAPPIGGISALQRGTAPRGAALLSRLGGSRWF